jgi:hypothetical protein
MIVIPANQSMFPWLTSRAQSNASPDMKAIAVIDNEGHIHGMAGFDGWTPNSVVGTIALDSPIAFKRLIWAMFHFAFVQANRGVLLATVRGTNTRSLRLCKHVGMKEVYRVRDGIAVGEDLVVFEMRREDCRWIAPSVRRAA